jgi:hypothetical protein
VEPVALDDAAAARHGPEELIEAPMQYLSINIYPRHAT